MDKEAISLVTGGASGICLEVAKRLVKFNKHVVVVDKDEHGLDELRKLRIDNLTAIFCDVEKESDIEELFEKLAKDNLMPTVLVNGVGGDARKIPFASLTQNDLSIALQQNLYTAFLMCRYALPHMEKCGFGRIVNFASVAGRTYTIFSNTAYVCAKGAVMGLTKQLAYEFADKGITVNTVAHGPIATKRIQEAWDKKTQQEKNVLRDQIPLKRLGEVNEAAAVVVHLCSFEAGYTTGSTVDVNGGMYI